MNAFDRLTNAPTFAMGLCILAAIFIMAGIRYKETSALLKKYSRESIRLMTFAVNFFGQESVIKKPLRSVGALLLLDDHIFYKARFGKLELIIPGKNIRNIGTTDYLKDRPLNQKVVSITFVNDEGKPDRVALRIPHPERWAREIKIRFLV